MQKLKDLTGKRFGRWTVIAECTNSPRKRWVCRCDCGNVKDVCQYSLIRGDSTSCGCFSREEASARWKNKDHSIFSNYKEFKAGQRFGRLTIIRDTGKRTDKKNKIWECQCDCGAIIEAPTRNLAIGDLKSCGCLYKEVREINQRNFVDNFVANDCVEDTSLTAIDCSRPIRKDNTSGVRGVSWHSQSKKWWAGIAFQKKKIYLGIFDNIEDAAKARKLAEEKYFEPIIEKYRMEGL